MTGPYVVGTDDEGTFHVWDSMTRDEEHRWWPCGPTAHSGLPAACGHERATTVGGMGVIADTLLEALADPDLCADCAAHLAARHKIPEDKLPPEVSRKVTKQAATEAVTESMRKRFSRGASEATLEPETFTPSARVGNGDIDIEAETTVSSEAIREALEELRDGDVDLSGTIKWSGEPPRSDEFRTPSEDS